MKHFAKHFLLAPVFGARIYRMQRTCIVPLFSAVLVINANAQWAQQGPKLVGTGAAGPALQGYSVSVSGDGNTAIVGGRGDNFSVGAAWIFTRSAGAWSQQGPKLVGTGAAGPALQGYSVSVSGDGNTAIVGGYDDNDGVGATWIFTRTGGVWTQQGPKLIDTSAVDPGSLGISVSISSDGNTAIAGEFGDNNNQGAAVVFTRSGGVWTQQAKLVGTGVVGVLASQGYSVSISSDGNTAIIGGIYDDSGIGAAWIFTRSGGLWAQQAKLVGTGATINAYQGYSVSISSDGNTAIVGGDNDNNGVGASWVFNRTGGAWTQQGPKLIGTGAANPSAQGYSVSISSAGDTVIVGGAAPNNVGAVWFFTRSAGVWTQNGSKLVGSDTVGQITAGYSVSISADGSTAIIGGSGDNNAVGAAWVFVKMEITRPRPGERWIAGDQDTIRWTCGRPGQFLNIEFSTDSGATHAPINLPVSIPADSGYYIWIVPDSLTTRAKIRLTDVSNSNPLAESDTFKVKGYVLTRLNSIGHYERYLPTKDGWSFANAIGGPYWPRSWWSRFHYAGGTDPNTGDPYPSAFTSLPVAAHDSDFVDWPLFTSTFGRDQCFWSFTDFYRTDAINSWGEVSKPWNGSCFGIAVSSLLAFHYKDQFLARHPGIPNFDSLAVFRTMTDSIRFVINGYFTMQYAKIKEDHDEANASTTPRQTLQWIKQMLSNDDPDDDASLRYIDPAGSGGHAVVPYKLDRIPSIPNQFRLRVCNSNNPSSLSDFILIDSLTNTWQEFTGFGWGIGTLEMYPHPPANQFLLRPILPSRLYETGVTEAVSNEMYGKRLQVNTSSTMNVSIRSQAGDSVGFANGFAFNSMENALPLIPEMGHPHPPLGYVIPPGDYTLSASNFLDSTMYVSVSDGSLSLTYSRRGAGSGQSDYFSYDGSLKAKNTDPTSRTYTVQVLVSEDSSEKTCNLGHLILGANDSVSASATAGNAVHLVNYGVAKNYHLGLRSASRLGEHLFDHDAIMLPTQSTHTISPQWDSLGRVQILVDLGNNGTIDDTLILNNTVDVGERGTIEIPREYNLAQNYPNPFNPTTTIRYELASASHVTLMVYNVLGQHVVTLVDEERQAGRFSVDWNGNDAAWTKVGSGVYFYRLDAKPINGSQGFTRVKKMLLLK